MAEDAERYTVRVHQEPGHELWAEVLELPGCFASGAAKLVSPQLMNQRDLKDSALILRDQKTYQVPGRMGVTLEKAQCRECSRAKPSATFSAF